LFTWERTHLFTAFASDPRRRAKALTFGIIAVGMAITLAMWATVIASVVVAREAAMDRARSEGHNLAVAFADEVNHILDGVAGAMEIIAQRMRAAHGRLDIYAWAHEIPLLSSATIQAAIVGPDGRLISTTLDPTPNPIDLSDREHIRVHLDGRVKGIFIGKPVTGRVSHQITINVTRRVDAEDGTLLGVVMFALSPAYLTTLHTVIDLGPRGSIALIGLDEVIRARFTSDHPDGLAGIGESIAGGPKITENLEGSFVRESVTDSVTRLYNYRRVPDYPLAVGVGRDFSDALASFRAHGTTMAVIAGMATVLLAGLAAYLVREIDHRTEREIELADERSKLHEVNRMLEADIALRQKAEDQLRMAQQTLRDAVDSISEGFVIFDDDDCLVMSNEPYRRLYPESAQLMIPGTPFEEIMWAGVDAGRYTEAVGCESEWLSDRIHAHENPSGATEQRLADGRCVMVCERRMQNGGNAGLHIDITRLKATENELRQNRDNLNRAQRVAKIGSFERDLRTGEVVWSEEHHRIFGRNPADPPPNKEEFLLLIDPEDRPSYEASMIASENGFPVPPLTYRIHCPDGCVKWIYTELETIFDNEGNPVRRVGTIRDVTELRASEKRQRELEHQLLHSQKLEAVGTLAGGIAHDLNNTLTPILALSSLLIDQMPKGSSERADLEIILQASRRGRDLLQRILAFSRDQETAKTTVDLAATTRACLQMLRATVPATVLLNEEIAPVPLIHADAGQLQQIIVNLVTNARQAIGNHLGTITVAVSPLGQSQMRADGSQFVLLRVSDTGCGMDAETKNRIFEPFFTTKEVGEGTGLGLSVVHGIVTDHGGRIEVTSQPGCGTEFAIFLPIARSERHVPQCLDEMALEVHATQPRPVCS
jgi:signal transduction histidine kinase